MVESTSAHDLKLAPWNSTTTPWGGGLLTLIHKQVPYNECLYTEDIKVKVSLSNEKQIIITNVYRSPIRSNGIKERTKTSKSGLE